MSDFVRGMAYSELASAKQALAYVSEVTQAMYDDRLIDSAENMVSNIRASLSKINRAIEEARERMEREHNQVAAE